MKSRIFATFGSLTLLTAAAAFGQSTTVMHADVPFDFHVGKKVLPAGHYEVRPQISPGVLAIRGTDGHGRMVIITNGIEGKKVREKGTLVFNCIGDSYFLATVWIPGYSEGRLLRESKEQRELGRRGSPASTVEIALDRP
jgi:hypothetical protein